MKCCNCGYKHSRIWMFYIYKLYHHILFKCHMFKCCISDPMMKAGFTVKSICGSMRVSPLVLLLGLLLAVSAQHWSHGWYPGGKRELDSFGPSQVRTSVCCPVDMRVFLLSLSPSMLFRCLRSSHFVRLETAATWGHRGETYCGTFWWVQHVPRVPSWD